MKKLMYVILMSLTLNTLVWAQQSNESTSRSTAATNSVVGENSGNPCPSGNDAAQSQTRTVPTQAAVTNAPAAPAASARDAVPNR